MRDFPPGPGEAKATKRRLLRIIDKIYVKGAGVREPGTPEYHAEELFKIVSALRESNQLYQWPGEGEEGNQTFQTGQEVRFTYFDQQGVSHMADEVLILPKYPITFIDALEAYIAGKSWNEVKEIMTHDPDIADKEIREIFETNIDAVKSPKDVVIVMRSIGPRIASKKVREALVLRLAQRFERMVDTEAMACTSFRELDRFREDVRALIESLKGTDMPTYGARDALDAAALELAKRLFDKATTYKQVKQVADAVDGYPFAFEDFYTKPLQVRAEDVRTKIRFLYALRHSSNIEQLTQLEQAVHDHSFGDKVTSGAYKIELLDLVRKKKEKYKNS